MTRVERSRYRLLAVILTLAMGALLDAGLTIHLSSDNLVRINLAVSARHCVATFNDRASLTLQDDSPTGTHLGLYGYSPCEGTGDNGHFRDLTIRASPWGERSIPLVRPDDRRHFAPTPDWVIAPGKGLRFRGVPGRRGALLLNQPAPEGFRLSVTLRGTPDSGVLFRATDEANGLVLVARPLFNDAFFFRLIDGEPGPILALTPLRQLGARHELLRLVHLILDLTVRAGAFTLLLWILLRFVPDRAMPGTAWITRLAHSRWLQPAIGLALATAMSAVALLAYDAIPHIEDEKAYFFQAKIFAAGRLWAPAPAAPVFFEHWHVILSEGRWFGKYPPLFPALLALGLRAGAHWLVNPVLGAVIGLCIFQIARDLRGPLCGLTAALLAMTSPFFLIMGGGLMSHMTAAALLWLAALFIWKTLRSGNRFQGFAAGVCGGLAVLARPYTSLLFLAALAAFGTLAWLAHRRRETAAALALSALGFLPLAGLHLAWNFAHTHGSTSSVGLYELYDRTDTLGFGSDKGTGQRVTWGTWGHTPAKAIRSAWQYLDHTSHYLLGWPARLSPAFALLALLLMRRRREFGLLVAPAAALAAGHALYWSCEHVGVGARYWFEAVPGIFVLTAAGIHTLAETHNPGAGKPESSPLNVRQAVLMLVLTGLVGWNLIGYLPVRLSNLHRLNDITADLQRTVQDPPLAPKMDRAIVFVKTDGLYRNDGFHLNDPFLLTGPIFARDLGDRNVELLRLFPDRQAFQWDRKRLRPLPSNVTGPSKPDNHSAQGEAPHE